MSLSTISLGKATKAIFRGYVLAGLVVAIIPLMWLGLLLLTGNGSSLEEFTQFVLVGLVFLMVIYSVLIGVTIITMVPATLVLCAMKWENAFSYSAMGLFGGTMAFYAMVGFDPNIPTFQLFMNVLFGGLGGLIVSIVWWVSYRRHEVNS